MFRRIVKVLNILVLTLTTLVCLFLAGFLAPRLFGIKPFVVLSGSMEPTVPTGSVVFVDTRDRDVSEGDIITYSLAVSEDEGVYVTHRVHAITEDGLIQTKGDNNEDPDGYLEPEGVTGTVSFHLPYLGYALDLLQGTGYVLVMIWILVANGIVLILSRFCERDDE